MRSHHCEYCDNLNPAIDTINYCSHKNTNVDDIDSNAYYFMDNRLSSGKHLSRFSVRAVYNGYQHYQVNQREHLLSNDRFLVINEGESFENSIEQDNDAEGIIVAFNPNFLKYYLYHINHTDKQLLDSPFKKLDASLLFYENSYEKSKQLDSHLRSLIKSIKLGKAEPIFYQQKFIGVLDELVGVELYMKERISKIKALKGKTREELYKRLSTAKDFIDANLDTTLSLEKIAHVSFLSPFHFLRSFSDCYGITPYQYVKRERLKKAMFLVEHSHLDLTQIISASGFENKRTFQRAYQKRYGLTPFAHLEAVRL